MVVVVDVEMFGTAYGLSCALLNVGNMIACWQIGDALEDNKFSLVMYIWLGMSVVSFIVSAIWNSVDYSYSNMPSNDDEQGDFSEDNLNKISLK